MSELARRAVAAVALREVKTCRLERRGTRRSTVDGRSAGGRRPVRRRVRRIRSVARRRSGRRTRVSGRRVRRRVRRVLERVLDTRFSMCTACGRLRALLCALGRIPVDRFSSRRDLLSASWRNSPTNLRACRRLGRLVLLRLGRARHSLATHRGRLVNVRGQHEAAVVLIHQRARRHVGGVESALLLKRDRDRVLERLQQGRALLGRPAHTHASARVYIRDKHTAKKRRGERTVYPSSDGT